MTNSAQTTSQNDYNVGLTLSATVLGQTLKSQDSWDWTVTSNNTVSTATVDTTGFTLGQPSGGYTGPTDLQIYFDNRYHTYYFRPIALTAPTFRGVLVNSSGAPIPGQIVSVAVQGKRFYAATNVNGEYRFSDPAILGPVSVTALGVTKQVSASSSESFQLQPSSPPQ
jgi:hypothetical protein